MLKLKKTLHLLYIPASHKFRSHTFILKQYKCYILNNIALVIVVLVL